MADGAVDLSTKHPNKGVIDLILGRERAVGAQAYVRYCTVDPGTLTHHLICQYLLYYFTWQTLLGKA